MTRLLVVGDTHGDFAFASKACRVAQANEITTIFQVGDFGIWDHTDDGVYFLDKLNENAERRGVRWVFVPGNHENYNSLEQYQWKCGENRSWTTEGFTPIRDNIHYTGKVNDWTWDGKTFKAVGGAVSIDRYARVPGRSWWVQEQLTDSELALAIDLGPVDYLLTHDCPTNAPFGNRLKPDLDSVNHRQKMNQVGRASKAKVWIHGHMHSWYDYWFEDTKVYGLECNDNAMWPPYGKDIKNMVILDTDTGKVTPVTEGN